ncbi:uncharacterized protein MKZ38_008374 [Zalerion maritima]|uniref:Alpha-taxilin n=1 Tax=Zalerion maritima TaxID=339359 RepID=A0AAD5RVZ0_9PEZI|nr:uncharacterized protein MKZ38_008374 [Zalerion maritima]
MTNPGEPRPPPQPPVATGMRKAKNKQQKTVDSSEASKLISARISQLEHDAAGEKGEEVEIDREVKRVNRELNGQLSKMNQDQRIDHLQKRCSELLADMKRLERENIKHKKRSDQLQKDKDQNRSELTKTVSIKEKMEKLARELQKESNRLKGENRVLSDEKSQNSAAWDEKYATLFQKMEDYQEEKDNPKKQVVDMEMDELFKTRMKSLIEQYELRELHFHSLMRTKELEVQVNMGRYEKEKKNAEAEANRARQLNAQVQTFSKTETELRNQLNVYVDKFKQVEDTLNNSNELFLTFRKEMEDMSKKTKRLEKENNSLKKKHDAMNKNILKMAEERSKHLNELENLKKKNEKLKAIIQQMQQQGRGIPQGMAATVNNCYADADNGDVDEEEEEEDDSDYYEDEDEEGEEVSGDGEYDDDTEEDIAAAQAGVAGDPAYEIMATTKPYGPPRPPVAMATPAAVTTAATPTMNGHK